MSTTDNTMTADDILATINQVRDVVIKNKTTLANQEEIIASQMAIIISQKETIAAAENINEEKDAIIAQNNETIKTLNDRLTAALQVADQNASVSRMQCALRLTEAEENDKCLLKERNDAEQKIRDLTKRLEAANEKIATLTMLLTAADNNNTYLAQKRDEANARADKNDAMVKKYREVLDSIGGLF